ncbi:glycoside hydrolase family 88 protein [bacterium]|nr:glycoside hydrolase family 88 protein [bacterium]
MMNRIKIMRCCLLVLSIVLILFSSHVFSQIEWAQQVIESTMRRSPPSSFGNWAYPRGFYLFGQYRFWKMTGEGAYFQFLRDWVDQHVDSQGNIDADISSLDNTQPGLVTLLCYVETGEEKYKLAAQYIRQVYHTYPRTSDGAFWHNKWAEGQLWSDGVYMVLPFLVRYGQVFNEPELFTECAHQLITYASHLQYESGLLFHAYDEDGSSDWADPVTHHSPWFWGRAIGWFGMALIEVLEIIPEDHADRAELITILSNLIHGLSEVQDEDTGLFYQVVDQGGRTDNWLESSCSCMYSYFTARAIARGYVGSEYEEMAEKAYEGVLRDKFSVDTQGLTYLKDICQGTGVSSDYSYYYNRSRNTNDQHGLGAFLMMCWQMAQSGMDSNTNRPPIVTFKSPQDSTSAWPGTDIPISVTAIDMDGKVVRVEFFANNTSLGVDEQAPWEIVWQDAPEGEYLITAAATDDSAETATSAPIILNVTDDVFYIEAETGYVSNGTIDSNHPGFTGTGFVNLENQAGTYLELTLNLPESGSWSVRFFYANGTENNRPCEIRLDDRIIKESFDFLPTGDWPTWMYSDSLNLRISDGEHVLRITGLKSASAPNLDHLEWSYHDAGTGPNDFNITFEAEDGFVSDGSVDTEHAGFTGAGFVNLENYSGTYLELSLNLPASGSWNVRVHYANGSESNRPCEIQVDGSVFFDSFDFSPTDEWTDWTYSGIMVLDLTAGEHVLRITGLESGSAPNLDHFEFILNDSGTDIEHHPDHQPHIFQLDPSFPNPFNHACVIRYHLSMENRIRVNVLNIRGSQIATLIDEQQTSGDHRVRFDAEGLPSGIYIIELRAGGYSARQKAMLVK